MKSSYLDSSSILFQQNNNGAPVETLQDIKVLIHRIEDIMSTLNNDARTLIYASYKQSITNVEQKLSTLIYDNFLVVINYIMNSLGKYSYIILLFCDYIYIIIAIATTT